MYCREFAFKMLCSLQLLVNILSVSIFVLFTYTDFLEPYKLRPETTASTARNLVHGALGLRRPSSKHHTSEHKKRSKKSDGNFLSSLL